MRVWASRVGYLNLSPTVKDHVNSIIRQGKFISLIFIFVFACCTSVVEINLREDYMRDGKPGYERLKVCLDRLGEMDFIMAYNNDFGELQQLLWSPSIC